MTNPRWQLVLPVALTMAWIAALQGFLPAQIDRISYRHWAWLQQQRRILLTDLTGQSESRQEAAAVALTDNSEQLPLLTIARAIATARDVVPDAGFLYRAGLQVYALPEVLAKGRKLSVTVHAPYTGLTGKLPQPTKFRFELKVTNAKGEVVHRDRIAESEEFHELRQFLSVCNMKLTDHPEGSYVVHVDTILDGKSARATDLPLRVSMGIMYDYGDRAGAFRLVPANKKLVATISKLAPIPRALLHGVSEYASRAWFGTPGVDAAHAIPDLLRAERIRKNIEAEAFPLRGVGGRATIALPAPGARPDEKEVVFVTLRLPEAGLPAKDSADWQALAKKPLVLFMPSVPSLDYQDRRPSFPHYALPSYLAESLRVVGFDAKCEFQLAVVESPGRVPNTRRGLQALLRHLPEVFPFDPDRLVLVGDAHGASGMADLALQIPKRVRGLVLVNGNGGLATPQLRKLRKHPILIIPGYGKVSPDDMRRFRIYAKLAEKTSELEIRDDRKWPWSIALPLAAPEIEAFARRASAR